MQVFRLLGPHHRRPSVSVSSEDNDGAPASPTPARFFHPEALSVKALSSPASFRSSIAHRLRPQRPSSRQ